MSEIHKRKNIKGSLEFPFLVEKMKFEVGLYEEGAIVEYDPDTKKLKPCTDPENLYGVVTDEVTITTQNTEAPVYITGIFNYKALTNPASIAKELLNINGRKLSLFFR